MSPAATLSAPILGVTTKAKLKAASSGWIQRSPRHEVVKAELAARRQGTHATKTRAMVAGGRSKPWRQKGTGRARAGTTRAAQWTGGGVVFGPQPRNYTGKVNRKAHAKALRSRSRRISPTRRWRSSTGPSSRRPRRARPLS